MSLTHSGCAGSFTVVHKKLSLWGLFVLGIPHASFGVVVVKKVPQTESFNLQTILQDPAVGNRDGKTNTGLKVKFYSECWLRKEVLSMFS